MNKIVLGKPLVTSLFAICLSPAKLYANNDINWYLYSHTRDLLVGHFSSINLISPSFLGEDDE